MKTTFKIGAVEVAGVKVEGIEVSADYSMSEVRGVYDLFKTIVKDAPEIIEDLAVGARKFQNVDFDMERFSHRMDNNRKDWKEFTERQAKREKLKEAHDREMAKESKPEEAYFEAFLKDLLKDHRIVKVTREEL